MSPFGRNPEMGIFESNLGLGWCHSPAWVKLKSSKAKQKVIPTKVVTAANLPF
jgi:hypothetical protein